MAICPRCQLFLDDDVQFSPKDGERVVATGAPRARERRAPASAPTRASDPDPADDPHIGQLLGDEFEILSVAGRGAMGTVYKAEQRAMDRPVAVKILRGELLRDTGLVRRFVREARATAKLQHPNIVTVHFVGETPEGLPFLVMEYVDGRSLEEVCQKPLPLARTLDIARQITSALGDAHDAGIIHRDLKPSNVLVLERPGQPDRVKVVDFGIAKILEWGDNRESMLTQGGVIFGTPDYLAPEQASGHAVDARTDLYALGVILFRLVTGQLPFRGTGMQLVLKHLREVPPLPSTLAPDVPPDVEELIVMLLSKDPDHRPPTARAVEVTLERLANAAALPPPVVKPIAVAMPRSLATGPVRSNPRPVMPRAVREDDAPRSVPHRSRQRAFFWLALALGMGTGGGLLVARFRDHERMAPVAQVAIVADRPPVVPAPNVIQPLAHPTVPAVPISKHKARRDDDSTMPVTVIPATPHSSPAGYPQVPLRLPSTSANTHVAPAPRAPNPPPATVVVEPPPPAKQPEQSVVIGEAQPRPAPKPPERVVEHHDEDPPAQEPARPVDPTTLPLPGN